MSDLISRKSLKDRASKYTLSHDEYKRFCEIIDSVPVAYDINKVVDELETNKQNALEVEESIKEYNVWNKAIEIVKHGGVADDVCEWECKYINNEYVYSTSCDNIFIYETNSVYCPYCGKKIKVVEE